MTTILDTLQSLEDRCGLIPFITAGSPSLEGTREALKLLDASGADIIEVGLPYSDPLADGPVIQQASKTALQQGMTLDKLLQLIEQVSTEIKAPLVLFTYYNPVLARGISIFLQDIANAGIKGIVIPDLPLEEADYVSTLCFHLSLELILLITPTSSDVRINNIINKSHGLIYVVSSTGVTGVRNNIQSSMGEFISNIKSRTNKLLILGFGIAQVKQVEQVIQWDIDGVVIGSAFVKRLENPDCTEGLNDVRHFCLSMRKAVVKSSTL
uniref:Tryptophan synthase alpha subunit n=1 Tax=Nemalion vermiculare TaxID=935621 RepID=UPI00257E721E|nr:Tryptophan synthase alpha subunit [Nemalion vermiculare]WGV34359.1 Tryptophan synthase alpha subunit [Nemalion vermiculare]